MGEGGGEGGGVGVMYLQDVAANKLIVIYNTLYTIICTLQVHYKIMKQ